MRARKEKGAYLAGAADASPFAHQATSGRINPVACPCGIEGDGIHAGSLDMVL